MKFDKIGYINVIFIKTFVKIAVEPLAKTNIIFRPEPAGLRDNGRP